MSSFLKQPKIKMNATSPKLTMKQPRVSAPPLPLKIATPPLALPNAGAAPLTLGSLMGANPTKPAKKKKSL
jgi:hypothetical protein